MIEKRFSSRVINSITSQASLSPAAAAAAAAATMAAATKSNNSTNTDTGGGLRTVTKVQHAAGSRRMWVFRNGKKYQ